MDTRFLIFGIVSTIFFAGIYSSSTALGQEIVTSCTHSSKTTDICTTIDDDGLATSWECKTKNGGKTWSCEKVKEAGEAIPPSLKDALSAKVQGNIITTNKDSSPTPPPCPNTGPIPPDCTMKPLLK
jgi:hypothetical protein